MIPGSKRAVVALLNLSNRLVTLKIGTIIATIKAANIVLPMLALKQLNTNNNQSDDKIPKKTPKRLEKLFTKLDLEGIKSWTEEQKRSN